MSKQRTFYIINCEAVEQASDIRAAIERCGLKIIDHRTVSPSRILLAGLNPDAAPELLKSICVHKENHECEIGLVEGENAVELLATVNGRNSRPFQNPPWTLRYRFSRDLEIVHHEHPYPFCAIDCPQDDAEASRGLMLLRL